jgi:hypothetical protein
MIAKLISEDPYHTLGGKVIYESFKGKDRFGAPYEISQSGDVFVISYPDADDRGEHTSFRYVRDMDLTGGGAAEFADNSHTNAYGRDILSRVANRFDDDIPMFNPIGGLSSNARDALKYLQELINNFGFMATVGNVSVTAILNIGGPILSIAVDRSDVTIYDNADGDYRATGKPATDEQMMMICRKIMKDHIEYIQNMITMSAKARQYSAAQDARKGSTKPKAKRRPSPPSSSDSV